MFKFICILAAILLSGFVGFAVGEMYQAMSLLITIPTGVFMGIGGAVVGSHLDGDYS